MNRLKRVVIGIIVSGTLFASAVSPVLAGSLIRGQELTTSSDDSGVEVSNAPIALYPLVIIPVFAVPLSALLHLFSLRRLYY